MMSMCGRAIGLAFVHVTIIASILAIFLLAVPQRIGSRGHSPLSSCEVETSCARPRVYPSSVVVGESVLDGRAREDLVGEHAERVHIDRRPDVVQGDVHCRRRRRRARQLLGRNMQDLCKLRSSAECAHRPSSARTP